MLEAKLKHHRDYLLAQSAGQKLFLTLTVRPTAEARQARPDLSVVFVVDTSGSMREVVTEPTERTGRTTQVWDAEVRNERGDVMALFRCTQAVLYPRN